MSRRYFKYVFRGRISILTLVVSFFLLWRFRTPRTSPHRLTGMARATKILTALEGLNCRKLYAKMFATCSRSAARLPLLINHRNKPRNYATSGELPPIHDKLTCAAACDAILKQYLDDIVIISALRTPFTRAVKGGLAKTYPEELLAQILKATISRTKVGTDQIREVAVGTVLQQLGGQKASAMAVKDAGFPHETTTHTINRQCASSSQALSTVAAMIKSGAYEAAIAAGVESMTMDYFPHRGIPPRVAPTLLSGPVQESKDVIVPMGLTSENVAEKHGITREIQDAFAVESQRKAEEAQKR
jgi:hypothetical protein